MVQGSVSYIVISVMLVATSMGSAASAQTSTPTATRTPIPPYGVCQIPLPGRAPQSLAGADFNADDVEDIAVLDSRGADVLLINGAAQLAQGNCNPPTVATPTPIPLQNGEGVALTALNIGLNSGIDLATAQRTGAGVLQNLGSGNWSVALFRVGDINVVDPGAVAAGNMDGDNNEDLIIGGRGDCRIHVLYGVDGTGSFDASSEPINVESPVDALAIADLNLDGKLDIVALSGVPPEASPENDMTPTPTPRTCPGGSGPAGPAVRILLNTSDRGFAPFLQPLSFVPPNPVAIAIGNFDSDAAPDIAIVDGPGVVLQLPTPTSTPSPATPEPTATLSATPQFTGTPPTAAPTSTPTETLVPTPTATRTGMPVGHLEIFISQITPGTTQASFRAEQTLDAGHGPASIAVGQFNSDGAIDAVVTSVRDDRLLFFYGDGRGQFALGDPCTDACTDQGDTLAGCCVGIGPRAVIAMSVDNDLRLDLIVGNADEQSLSILRSSNPTPTMTGTVTRTPTTTNTPGPTRTFTEIPDPTSRPTATCPPTGICVQGESCAISPPQRSASMVWPWLGATVLWFLGRRKRR